MQTLLKSLALGVLVVIGAWVGVAKNAEAQAPFTGVELALSGSSRATPGRDHRLRGTAYRVRGLSTLVRYPRATLRARMVRPEERPAGPWVDVVADAEGRFEIALPIPAAERGAVGLDVELVDGDEGRTWSYPLLLDSPLDVMLLTDRRLYEPGETIHVFALVRDALSFQPVVGEEGLLTVTGVGIRPTSERVRTSAAGVISIEVPVAERAEEGAVGVELSLRGAAHTTSTSVGTRTYERVFVTLRATPELAAPHEAVSVRVEVTTTSGAPVTGASIDLVVDGQTHYAGATQSDGVATIGISAPAYMTHDTGRISLVAEVTHPAHGSAHAYSQLSLAVPLTLSMDVVPRLGAGLVPELDDVFYLVVADGLGHPPAAGLEIEIEGGAVRGGRARVTTDANGIAEVPAHLPAGMWGQGEYGEGGRSSLFARIQGPLERTARLSLPVQRYAQVSARVLSSVVHPGARVEVEIARSPAVRGKPAVVEVSSRRGLIAVRQASASTGRVSFDAPTDQLGVIQVCARALDEAEVAEGEGACDALLVVPSHPSFIQVAPERTEYLVGQSARVSITSEPGQPGYAAVLIRDLAAHAGEAPFQRFFLERAFREAILAPNLPSAERLLRTALSAQSSEDPEATRAQPLLDALGLPNPPAGVSPGDESRGTLRDPFPLARELERHGVADYMQSVELLLEEALANDSLDEVTVGRGPGRRFAADILEGETLGGGPIQVAHLEGVDASFSYHNVARRVARARLVRLLVALATYLDPGDEASVAARMAAREPYDRWLPRMIERGLLSPEDLRDPWGGRYTLRPSARPALVLSVHSTGLELLSPGPDGRPGTADDVRDPFARAVPAGTPYAVASGEDSLMRRLALISPVSRTLSAIHEAYLRITAEMTEELIGDAVHAGVSEGVMGLGLVGTGSGGGGSGSGYGSGSGSFSSRGSSVPRIRSGSASVIRGLAHVIRQRFPATLLFRPTVALDPSGTTWVDVPLQDAVTTYLVEVISWRPDGWSWSADTRFSVDRELVVEAPVPEVARVGDEISMPVRLGNRGSAPRELLLHLLATPEIGLAAGEPRRVRVGARDAVAEHFTLAPTHAGEGLVRVAVTTLEGEAIDAIALPMRVLVRARRARVETDTFVDERGTLEFDVPAAATARDGEVTLVAGRALFAEPEERDWALWAEAMGDELVNEPSSRVSSGLRALQIGVLWVTESVEDSAVEQVMRALTRDLDALDSGDDLRARVDAQSRALLLLAPTLRRLEARPALRDGMEALLERVRRSVAADAASVGDAPEVLVASAAALAWTRDGRDSRASELLRRAERALVELGDERFVATQDAPLRATALFALADAALGNRERALALVRTLARWSSRGRPLTSEVRAYARLVLHALEADSPPSDGVVVVDGRERAVQDAARGARFSEALLAEPGHHVVDVRVDRGAIVHARVRATYGLPWESEEVVGPVTLAIEGESGGLDGVATYVLVVRNRTPRTLTAPVVEIDLPTGAELPEAAQRALRSASRGAPTRAGDLLTLTLSAMPPGAERRVPLLFRWSVAGTLPGLGVVAYASDRPEQVSVLPPRVLTIRGGGR